MALHKAKFKTKSVLFRTREGNGSHAPDLKGRRSIAGIRLGK